MTETVVHVTTLEQWKSVLDVWFGQGYDWPLCKGRNDYGEKFYYDGSRQLGLNANGFAEITYWSLNDYRGDNLIEYSDFMAQKKEDNKMKTYYVTQKQFDLIEELKSEDSALPFFNLVNSTTKNMKELATDIPDELDPKILRYLGGDETIEFKVKETLYRLWRIDDQCDKVYMLFKFGSPIVTQYSENAFTAPLEEIKKHKTISWEIEEVK